MVDRLVSADRDSGQLPDIVLSALSARYSPDKGGKPVGKDELVYNVRDYGAKGDGTTDDSLAIQACVDAAIGGSPGGAVTATRVARARIYAPPGTYKTTQPIKFYGVLGLTFFGSGYATIFAASGTSLAAVFDINGARHCLFEDFSIQGLTTSDSVVAAVRTDWDSAISLGSTYGNTFRKVRVSTLRFVYGFATGLNSANRDVSQQTFQDCYAIGQFTAGETTLWQAGFVSGSGTSANVLDHFYYGCRSVADRYGFWCNAVSMSVFGSSVGFNEVDFYQAGARPFVVDGFRSENSQRLFSQLGGATFASSAEISNGLFTTGLLATDGYWIQQRYGGTVTLSNLTAQYTAGKTPKIQVAAIAGANAVALMTLVGVAMTTAFADRFVTSGLGSIVDTNAYVLTTSNQVSTTRALWAKQVGSFAQAQLPTFGDGLVAAGPVQLAAYATANRPSAASVAAGATVFDTTLGKPIWCTGSAWVDAAGTTV